MQAFTDAVGGFFNFIVNTGKTIRIVDVIDILIITYVIYIAIKFIRETRAAQLLKGILVLVVVMQAARILRMNVTDYIIKSTLQYGVLALLIVFQPELRNALEQVGRKGLGKFGLFMSDDRKTEGNTRSTIDALTSAVAKMSASKTGAIIVMERETRLGEIIKTGTLLDAAITEQLILNIFYPKSPLHDGAAVIRSNRLYSAGCVLPLTQNAELSKELGTRHRAGIGISEVSDAVVIIVSEETGIISMATGGVLKRRLTPDVLDTILTDYFTADEEKKEKKKIFPRLRDKKGE